MRGINRRAFLRLSGGATIGLITTTAEAPADVKPSGKSSPALTLFLCGDVMTGRGVDQVLPHPSDPRLCERYMTSALGYLDLAEQANGPIPKPVDLAYVWGDALAELERARPDARIINLETSVTTSGDCAPKGVNYRMHPQNVGCLNAAKIDCCVLANNHVLDWGEAGLLETLDSLRRAQIKTAGAGRNGDEAAAPAIIEVADKGRVIVFSFGSPTSGIPPSWAAASRRPGINLLSDFSTRSARQIARQVGAVKGANDVVIASIHWGGNWGFEIPREQSRFARMMIDEAGVDIVHGHSSHHAKGIEVYRDRLILYGCGDFLNDYEGITGYEAYRDDLSLMYIAGFDPAHGRLEELEMTPLRIKNFRLNRASQHDARWLRDVLNREGRKLGTAVRLEADDRLRLGWGDGGAG